MESTTECSSNRTNFNSSYLDVCYVSNSRLWLVVRWGRGVSSPSLLHNQFCYSVKAVFRLLVKAWAF
ncbi:hypothetical protein EB796_006028 [Bugula neritina]|uniref:Uncharacterized protein n=1 Tax=Bugula neritina TaxID=10212 RepID=A0A7J7KAI0_BUGNE|nr:hypothetical protein EB796_006028 [Bugula neritina]